MTDKEMYLQLAAVCREKQQQLENEITEYSERLKSCAYASAKWQQKEAEMLHKAGACG